MFFVAPMELSVSKIGCWIELLRLRMVQQLVHPWSRNWRFTSYLVLLWFWWHWSKVSSCPCANLLMIPCSFRPFPILANTREHRLHKTQKVFIWSNCKNVHAISCYKYCVFELRWSRIVTCHGCPTISKDPYVWITRTDNRLCKKTRYKTLTHVMQDLELFWNPNLCQEWAI